MNDLRFALRLLARSPGFTAVAVLVVAIGVGASSGMFSIINALVLQPISLPQPDRLAVVYETHLERNLPQFSVSIPNYADWSARAKSWKSLAAASGRSVNLTGGLEPELVRVQGVTANFLPTLGLTPSLGRNFTAEEDRVGGSKVAILSDAMWQSRFARSADVLGKTLTLDGTPYTIIGVTTAEAAVPLAYQILVPLAANVPAEDRMDHYLDVLGRLRDGVTLAQADAELKNISAQIFQEQPKLDRGWSTNVVPLEGEVVGPSIRTGLYVLFGAVFLLLLIGCANLSILLLTRMSARAHSLAVRTALGASRWQVIRPFVAESVLISLGGGALGLAILYWTVDVLRTLPLPRAGEIVVDSRVLAMVVVATVITGLLAGMGPALKAAKTDPQAALKSRSTRSGQSARLRDSLVVAQIALSLILLVGAALLARSFWRLLSVDPGFNSSGVLTLSLRPTGNPVPFYDAIEREVAALPGVDRVGFISRLPLTPGNTQNEVYAIGPGAVPAGAAVQASWRLIHGDYFGAMQIPLIRGRDFRGLTRAEARASMVISASLARGLWGETDPIGRQLQRANARFTVIGVVGDVRSQQLGTESMPAFYMSIHRFTSGPQSLVVRSRGDVAALVASVRQAVRKVDATVPVFDVQKMDVVRASSLQQERLLIALLGAFGAIALMLTALGTYGVVAFNVQQRITEIGVRVALGAQSVDVVRMVLAQGAKLVAQGLVLGLVGAFALTRVLGSLMYQTSLLDFTSYAVGIFALGLAFLIACLIPTRRALRVDPIVALRAE